MGKIAKQEPIIEKANKLRLASLNPKTRMQYEAREKVLKDIVSIRDEDIDEKE